LENKFPYNEKTFMLVAEHDSLENMKWLFEKGFHKTNGHLEE